MYAYEYCGVGLIITHLGGDGLKGSCWLQGDEANELYDALEEQTPEQIQYTLSQYEDCLEYESGY